MTRLRTIEGTVTICNLNGDETVRAGQIAESRGGEKPKLLDPDDAVQWALHYPSLDASDAGSERERDALRMLRAGRVDDALSRLDADDDGEDGAFALALRAIIAVTRNDTIRAERLGLSAVDAATTARRPPIWRCPTPVRPSSTSPGRCRVSRRLRGATGHARTS